MINKKKLLSYTLSSVVAVALAGGCITPAYYSHQQDISITLPEGATAEMDGKTLEKRGDTVHTTVDRSWRDKEIIVKKEGYKDEKIKLKSVVTNDKWAGSFFGRGRESGRFLLIPAHTLISAGAFVGGMGALGIGALTLNKEIMEGGAFVGTAGAIALPLGLTMDTYNIAVGIPSTAIINPWAEYEYKGVLRNMEPAENEIQNKTIVSKNQLQNEPFQNSTYKRKACRSQKDCGGINSGYFCNANGNYTPNRCEKAEPETISFNNQETYYYNKIESLQSWCREAFESQSDRDSLGNCTWGYLSYEAAKSWCESIGKQLLDAHEMEKNCEKFSFLPKDNSDQQYWTKDLTVIHMGQNCFIQKMVRGDGYAWAGGVICK